MRSLIPILMAAFALLFLPGCTSSYSKIKIKDLPATVVANQSQGDYGTAEFMRVKSVRLGEWLQVQKFALESGYDLGEPEMLRLAGQKTVYQVAWRDAVKWCNAKSAMEGLTPVYFYRGVVFKNGAGGPELNSRSNGYKWVASPSLRIAKINLR